MVFYHSSLYRLPLAFICCSSLVFCQSLRVPPQSYNVFNDLGIFEPYSSVIFSVFHLNLYCLTFSTDWTWLHTFLDKRTTGVTWCPMSQVHDMNVCYFLGLLTLITHLVKILFAWFLTEKLPSFPLKLMLMLETLWNYENIFLLKLPLVKSGITQWSLLG